MTDADLNRVGVVDIGSNSVRLVAYDLRQGLPLQLFNEKAICRLGEGVASKQRLKPGNIALALATLSRFAVLIEALGLDRVFVLATAAVREARNGTEFVTEVERVLPGTVEILSGAEEARLAALGVLAGLPGAEGLAGDLGGGSLELSELNQGQLGRADSLNIGPLPLIETANGDLGKARKEIDRQLAKHDWLAGLAPPTFYAVGGAWRTLARLEIAWNDHPLHMIHGYALPRDEIQTLLKRVTNATPETLAEVPGVSRQRLETLPYAALVMARLAAVIKPAEICFSSYGVREGFLYDRLIAAGRSVQPLSAATRWLAQQTDLPEAFAERLIAWTEPLFSFQGGQEREIRYAACRLSNLACYEHPEYRARQALESVLRSPSLPLRHADRAFLALALWFRYGGRRSRPEAAQIAALLPVEAARRARVLGLALGLAYQLSGGVLALLDQAVLGIDRDELMLRSPPTLPPGETVQRSLGTLAKAAGLRFEVEAD